MIINALAHTDIQLHCLSHDGLEMDGTTVVHRSNQSEIPIAEFDRIWVFGMGKQETFLDRIQILRLLNQSTFINSIDAFTYRHAKTGTFLSPLKKYLPDTFISNSPDSILQRLTDDQSWIVKPAVGSFGRDIYEVKKHDRHVQALLEQLCKSSFLLVQRKVDTKYEKRWLLAAGQVVAHYGKQFDGLAGNRHRGAVPVEVDSSSDEVAMVENIGLELRKLGIHYAACDIADGKLLDVNFVNPGFLASYYALTGTDLCHQVVAALFP